MLGHTWANRNRQGHTGTDRDKQEPTGTVPAYQRKQEQSQLRQNRDRTEQNRTGRKKTGTNQADLTGKIRNNQRLSSSLLCPWLSLFCPLLYPFYSCLSLLSLLVRFVPARLFSPCCPRFVPAVPVLSLLCPRFVSPCPRFVPGHWGHNWSIALLIAWRIRNM